MNTNNPASYFSAEGETVAEYTVERSLFLGYCSSARTEEEAHNFIAKIRKKHYDATHNCYAYICGRGRFIKSSDDGEPAGTAGQPILEILRKRGIIDTVIVVTRYFGGIKLGAGGLVRAYSQSASMALTAAEISESIYCKNYSAEVSYENYPALSNYLLSNKSAQVTGTDYAEKVTLSISFVFAEAEDKIEKLNDYMQGKVTFKISGSGYIKRKIN